MEALLAGKPRSAVLGALRSLLDPLRNTWGDPDGFVEEGLPVLAAAGGGVFSDEEQGRELLGQVYRQVLRIRALYFRPISSSTALDNAYKELDAQAQERQQTAQQVVLWLASRIQQSVLIYLGAANGRQAVERLYRAVDEERRDWFRRRLGSPEELTLGRLNGVLTDFVRDVMGQRLGRLETAALSGHLLETLRAGARKPPERAEDDAPEPTAQSALLGALVEPTRIAELNDAQARFGQMPDAEKSRRFNAFRLRLSRAVREVAEFAPLGFEPFCQAVEAVLFPYPAPLEFIRAFARPIWQSARQSTLFSETNTPQSVQQRYESLVKSRQGNPIVLELARAFALASFSARREESQDAAFVARLDLRGEFGWPTAVAELRTRLSRARR